MYKWLIVLCLLIVSNLQADVRVLALAGSSRKESFNKKLINEAASVAKQMGAKVLVVDLKDYPMPFYNGDLESTYGIPPRAKELRQLMAQSDVILISSPEYNASIPGELKNAIDWLSRKEPGDATRPAFDGKVFVLMSASPGRRGGARGLIHLRTVLEDVGATILPQQLTVPSASTAFDQEGHLTNPQLKQELREILSHSLKNN